MTARARPKLGEWPEVFALHCAAMRIALVCLLGATSFAGERLQDGKLTDPFWNLSFAAPELRPILSTGNPAVLFYGSCKDGVYIEITVYEDRQPRTGPEWRARRQAAWKKKKRRLTETSEGDEPRAWALFVETKYGVIRQHHGYVFYARGHHCFEVHAWTPSKSELSEAAIRTALRGLTLGEDRGSGLQALHVAKRASKPVLDPHVLAAAASAYLLPRMDNPALAAALFARARKGVKPDTFEPERRWRFYLQGGVAQRRSGNLTAAIEWLTVAENAARELEAQEHAATCAYELARACSADGRLDEAFAALDRAFADDLVVGKGRLSREKEFENARKDPRWEKFWRRRVKGR